MEKAENNPLNLYKQIYKQTILCKKLFETIDELKRNCLITQTLEKKIIEKFNYIMYDEICKLSKSKNTIKAKVTSYRRCDDIWIFNCKDISLKADNKTQMKIPRLKIIAVNEELRNINKG